MGEPRPPSLIIVADDYGYAPSYDAGILEATGAGALDGVGAMVLRNFDSAPLLETGVEIGLHLELSRADLERQLAEFERCFGQPPAYLDGHHHCHAEPGAAALAVARTGARLRIPVRSVGVRHRRLLRCLGAPTPDLLVGRLSEAEPTLPALIEAWESGEQTPAGTIEWMVHPGRAAGEAGSDYDRGRADDLALLLALGDREQWRRRGIVRCSPSALVR